MSSTEIVSPDKWFADGIHGDVLLCDPFTGRPLVAGGLHRPPDVFAQDIDLGGGYGMLQGSGEILKLQGPSEDEGNIEERKIVVAMLFTEPSDPHGLGSLADLRDNMGVFDVVGYANKRSISREATIAGKAPTIGAVTLGGEVIADDKYMEALYSVAADADKELFSFDPEVDIFGQPESRAAKILQKVEDVPRSFVVGQDLRDADARLLGTDLVYCNTLQWHAVGRIGNQLANVWANTDVFPRSALLIIPAEHVDLARKLGTQSADAEPAFARPELADIPDVYTYATALEHGFIPGAALR